MSNRRARTTIRTAWWRLFPALSALAATLAIGQVVFAADPPPDGSDVAKNLRGMSSVVGGLGGAISAGGGYAGETNANSVPFLGGAPGSILNVLGPLGKLSEFSTFAPGDTEKVQVIDEKVNDVDDVLVPGTANFPQRVYRCGAAACDLANDEIHEVTSVELDVQIAGGTPDNSKIDFDSLGLPSLGFTMPKGDSTKLNVDLDWTINARVIADTQGLRIAPSNAHELTLTAKISLPTPSFSVNLGALVVKATQKATPDFDGTPTFTGTLFVDIDDNGGLSFGFGPNSGFEARWLLATDKSPLPGVESDLHIVWKLTDTGVDATGLKITLENITVDTSELVGRSVREAAGAIRDVTHPIRTATSPLFEPIPGMSDFSEELLGEQVTMLRLMQKAGVGGDLGERLETLQFIDDGLTALEGAGKLSLGSITLLGSDALTPLHLRLPEGAVEKLTSIYKKFESACAPCKAKVDELLGSVGATPPGQPGMKFDLPVVKDPASLAGLLLGRDVDLVTFDTGRLGYDKHLNIPLARFLIFSVDLDGPVEASFDIKGGVDTRGITDALNKADPNDPADVLNGLYMQRPEDGKPAVKLVSNLGLRLATGIKVIEVSIKGGPNLDVRLDVPPNTPDGKLRPALAQQDKGFGCVLLEGGEASFDVNIEATFDYLIDDYTENLAEHTFLTRQDLCGDDDEDVEIATDDGNGNLTISTGTQRGVKAGEPDAITVYMRHDEGGAPTHIVITVNNNRSKPYPVAGITNLRFNSNADDRPVIFRVVKQDDTPFEKNVYVDTGNGKDDVLIDSDRIVQVHTNDGDDKIIVTAPVQSETEGEGDTTASIVSAGPGNDFIAGSDDEDALGGDAGNDVIYGGGGYDHLNGGEGNDTLVDSSPEGNCLVGSYGNDQLIGGPGKDSLFGDDVIGCPIVAEATDRGAKDDGTDVLVTGGGPDFVVAGGERDQVRLTSSDNVITIHEAESPVWKASATVYGNGGADEIKTGNGPDVIHGGPDDDQIYADRGPATDLFVNGDQDRIWGGTGKDLIEADEGADRVFGDNGIDMCLPPITGQPDESSEGDADDVDGGKGPDWIALEAGDDTADGFSGDDVICGHAGIDTIFAGTGADQAFGGTGDDAIRGEAGDDELFGNADIDDIDGGTGSDRIVGGSSKAGVLDAGDEIAGGDEADIIIGDNGSISAATPAVPSVFDLFAGDSALGGADTIGGGAGTDRVFGGLHGDTIHGDDADDHLEGNSGDDAVYGDGGEDDLIGGTSPEALPSAAAGQTAADASDVGETILSGGTGRDVIVGDNGEITRPGGTDPILGGVARAVTLLDRDRTGAALAAVSGGDYAVGNEDSDRIYGQGGADYLKGNEADDFVEGNQDGDRLEGNDGEDDLIGGSSFTSAPGVGDPDGADRIAGGAGADAILGDNAAITRATTGTGSGFDWDSVANSWLGQTARRSITLLDKATLQTANFGGDVLSGGAGVDVLFGQDGPDQLFGGSHDDAMEGNGGSDVLHGDQVASPTGDPRESVQPLLDGIPGAEGQDDQIGGSSWVKSSAGGAITGQRDANDELHGDGNADVQLGDNGRILRRIVNGQYLTFQPTTGKPTIVRQAAFASGTATALPARYDVGAASSALVWGNDVLYGDGGDDLQLAGDGDDTLFGGAADDDQYGELGNDRMSGEAGEDAMVGDRGVITNRLVASPGATISVTAPPAVQFTPYAAHPLDRRVDLNDDGDGAPLQAPGMTTGGNDLMRGGADHDALHGAAGNDLMNGDSGGDYLFGDNGADVMWGGKGRECANPADLACLSDRGANDTFVDYLFGGFGLKTDPVTGGADILDFRPRPGVDPTIWFEVTSTRPSDALADHQHHQGIDWIYGGWDRDVMEADVADNGPNAGDRLIDWTGAYNLYNHCPSAYGGYNDIRQLSPAMQSFLEQLAHALGAGKSLTDLRTKGTSGYNELALVYQADIKSNSGSAYPTTPGHFEQFSCEP